MNEQLISRRRFFTLAGGGAIVATVGLTGCGGAVIVRILPQLLRVGGVMLRVADGVLTIQGIAQLGAQILDLQVSSTDSNRLQSGANLIIEDGSSNRFNSAFGVFADVGIVQPCNPSGSLALRSQPSNNASVIRQLSADERLGVFDLRHQGGWYHVKTLGGEAGWVHGNCLQRLPRMSR